MFRHVGSAEAEITVRIEVRGVIERVGGCEKIEREPHFPVIFYEQSLFIVKESLISLVVIRKSHPGEGKPVTAPFTFSVGHIRIEFIGLNAGYPGTQGNIRSKRVI